MVRHKRRKTIQSSLPFIEFDGNIFKVNDSSIDFIKENLNPEESFGVVIVCGPYRQGKSFLLNRVILEHEVGTGFSVGETIQSCTKGLHLSTKILKSKDGRKLFVLDCEGMGDCHVDESHDSKIFTLGMLLCSMFIYNSKGSIDQPALNTLYTTVHLSQLISQEEDLQFPNFIWVVRDFNLEMVDENQNPIDDKQYLEVCLKNNHKVHNGVKEYFPHRNCFTLTRPCDDDDKLKIINQLPNSELKSDFVDKATQLNSKILETTPMKLISKDTMMTRDVFIKLAQLYCESLNNGKMPKIKDSWSMIARESCQTAYDQMCQEFESKSKELLDELSSSKLNSKLDDLRQQIITNFKSMITPDVLKAVPDVLDKLIKFINKQSVDLKNKQITKLKEFAEAYCDDYIEPFFNDCKTMDDFWSQLKPKLKKEYYSKTGTDLGAQAAINSQIVNRSKTWIDKFQHKLETEIISLQNDHKQLESVLPQIEKLTNENQSLQNDVQHYKDELQSLSSEMNLQKNHYTKLKANFDEKLQELTIEQDNLIDGNTSLTSECEELKTKVQNLQEQNDHLTQSLENNKLVQQEKAIIERELNELEQSYDLKTSEIEQLKNDLQASSDLNKKQLHDLKTSSEQLIEKLKTSKRELFEKNKSLQSDSKLKDDMIQKYEEQIKKLTKKLESSQAEVRQNLNNYDEKLRNVQKEHNDYVQKLNIEKQDEVNDLTTKNLSLSSNNQQLQNQLKRLESKFESCKKKMEDEIYKLKQNDCKTENEKLKNELESLKYQLQLQTESVRNQNEKIKELTLTNTSLSSELRQIGQKHETEIMHLKLNYENNLLK